MNNRERFAEWAKTVDPRKSSFVFEMCPHRAGLQDSHSLCEHGRCEECWLYALGENEEEPDET